MSEYCLKVNKPGSDTLIVSFAGYAKQVGGIPRHEFVRFLETQFAHTSRHFYMDPDVNLYHNGIRGLTKSVDETADYLRKEVQGYRNVLFLGASGGGYAAILFGSLLGVQSVVAFIPQTVRRAKTGVDEKYRDLVPHMHAETQYYLYGDVTISDPLNIHHISHCERVADLLNVHVTRLPDVHLPTMRDNGTLKEAIHNAIHNANKCNANK